MPIVAPIDLETMSRQRQGFMDRLGEVLGTWSKPVANVLLPDPREDPSAFMPGPSELGAPIMAQVWPEAKGALWKGWLKPFLEKFKNTAGAWRTVMEAEGPGLRFPESKNILAKARSGFSQGIEPLTPLREGLDLFDSRLPQYHHLTNPVTVQGEWNIPNGLGVNTAGQYLPSSDLVQVFGEPLSHGGAPGGVINILGHELVHSQQTPERDLMEPLIDYFWYGGGKGVEEKKLRDFFISSPAFSSAIRQRGSDYLDYLSNPAETMARGVANEITKRAFPARTPLEQIYGANTPLQYYTQSWPKRYEPLWRELADALAE